MLRDKSSARMVLLLACFTILALLPLAPMAMAGTVLPTETMALGSNGWSVIGHFQAEEQAVIHFSFNVTGGGPVDLLLLDESGYERYRLGSNASMYLEGSVLNASQGSVALDGLIPGQEYYLVMDNSASPLDGARPLGPVEVEYGLEGQNITEIQDQAGSYLIILAAIALIFIVAVVLLARARRAEREPGAQMTGLGRKYCPKCGEIVETYVHKCPKCGHEW
jgi:hypothetical protein